MWVKICGGMVGREEKGTGRPGRVKGGSGGTVELIELSTDPTKLP